MSVKARAIVQFHGLVAALLSVTLGSVSEVRSSAAEVDCLATCRSLDGPLPAKRDHPDPLNAALPVDSADAAACLQMRGGCSSSDEEGLEMRSSALRALLSWLALGCCLLACLQRLRELLLLVDRHLSREG